MPGDNATMDVELITPIAMEEKQRFAIREGGEYRRRRRGGGASPSKRGRNELGTTEDRRRGARASVTA